MDASVTPPLAALRRVAAHSLTLLHSRFEFATLELSQARTRLMRWLLLALVSAIMLLLTLLTASAAVTVLLWERFGVLTPVAFALGYGIVGAIVLAQLRGEVAAAPPLLSETLAELAQDRNALFGNPPATAPSGPGAEAARANLRSGAQKAQGI